MWSSRSRCQTATLDPGRPSLRPRYFFYARIRQIPNRPTFSGESSRDAGLRRLYIATAEDRLKMVGGEIAGLITSSTGTSIKLLDVLYERNKN